MYYIGSWIPVLSLKKKNMFIPLHTCKQNKRTIQQLQLTYKACIKFSSRKSEGSRSKQWNWHIFLLNTGIQNKSYARSGANMPVAFTRTMWEVERRDDGEVSSLSKLFLLSLFSYNSYNCIHFNFKYSVIITIGIIKIFKNFSSRMVRDLQGLEIIWWF